MRAILTYHSIDPSGSVISTSEQVFRRHVKWLARSAVKVVSVEDLLKLRDDVDAVALTFDDGFANFEETASRALSDSGLVATVFVVTDCVGGTNSWEFRSGASVPMLPLMDWHQLSRVHEQGFAIGAHTRSHANLARLRGNQLTEEISGCGDRIALELGTGPAGFAYPFGVTSPTAVREVSEDFEFACTTEFRPLNASGSVHLLPRLDMYYFREPGRLESFGTPAFARYVALRSGGRRRRTPATGGIRRPPRN